ncbi:hypothetical protein EBZ37_14790, partial [bacterium]|nr:hypothetical protein [bacterium]
SLKQGELQTKAQESWWKPTKLLPREAEAGLRSGVPLPEPIAETVFGAVASKAIRKMVEDPEELLRARPSIMPGSVGVRGFTQNTDEALRHSRFDPEIGRARSILVDNIHSSYQGKSKPQPNPSLVLISFNAGAPRQQFDMGGFFSHQAAQVLIVQEAALGHYQALRRANCSVVVADNLSEEEILNRSEKDPTFDFQNPLAIAVKASAADREEHVAGLTYIDSQVVWQNKKQWKCCFLVARIRFGQPYAGLEALTVASLHYNNEMAKNLNNAVDQLFKILRYFTSLDVDIVGVDLNRAAENHQGGYSAFSIAMTQLLAEHSKLEPKFATLLAQPPEDCVGFIMMPKFQRESPLLRDKIMV